MVEDAVQLGHAIDQRLDFAAWPADAEPAQEHRSTLVAAEGPDLVVAGDGHTRRVPQRIGEIECVHLLELTGADGRHRRGKPIGLGDARERTLHDLNGGQLHRGNVGGRPGLIRGGGERRGRDCQGADDKRGEMSGGDLHRW